jgi:hypothetical protein
VDNHPGALKKIALCFSGKQPRHWPRDMNKAQSDKKLAQAKAKTPGRKLAAKMEMWRG